MGAGRENPNLTQGSRADDKNIKITELDVETPLDHTTAIFCLKDN